MSYLRKIIPNSRISDIGRSTISSISVGMPIGLLLSLTYASQVITTVGKFKFPISRIGEQLPNSRIKNG